MRTYGKRWLKTRRGPYFSGSPRIKPHASSISNLSYPRLIEGYEAHTYKLHFMCVRPCQTSLAFHAVFSCTHCTDVHPASLQSMKGEGHRILLYVFLCPCNDGPFLVFAPLIPTSVPTSVRVLARFNVIIVMGPRRAAARPSILFKESPGFNLTMRDLRVVNWGCIVKDSNLRNFVHVRPTWQMRLADLADVC